MKTVIDLFVTGNLVCDRCEARKQPPELTQATPGVNPSNPRSYGSIICLAGKDPTNDLDITHSIIINGDLHINGISHYGNILVGGCFAVKEKGGIDASL